jgi:hypothetical protein
MQAFMLYMSGSGVQIFSMGTVFMLLSNPIKGVFGIQKGQSASHAVVHKHPADDTRSCSSILSVCSV